MRKIFKNNDVEFLDIEEEFTTSKFAEIKIRNGKRYTLSSEDNNAVKVEDSHTREKTVIENPSNTFEQRIKEKLKNNLTRFNTRY